MNAPLSFAVFFALLAVSAAHGADVFSAVAVSPQGQLVYASFKKAKTPLGIVSGLVEIRKRDYRIRALPLSKTMRERELRFLLPVGDRLLAVSQWVIEQGDDPLIHEWSPRKRAWKTLGKVACPLPIAAQLESQGIRFECEEDDATVIRNFAIRGLPIGGRVELPQAIFRAGGTEAALEGDKWEWDRIKITATGGKTRTIRLHEAAKSR